MTGAFPSILDQPSGYAPSPAPVGPVAELRAAASLLATLARQVERAPTYADQRKALERIPAARDALEGAAARLDPPPARPPALCEDCFRTEGETHRPWCPFA